jgi:hypothetical protein
VSANGQVALEVQWRISGKSLTPATHQRVIRKDGPSPETDPAGAAKTMSEALADLSRTLAEQLGAS